MVEASGWAPAAGSKHPRSEECRVPVSVFIFRRDFRLVDNTGLMILLKAAAGQLLPIIPLFLFNPMQCDPDKNPYFGRACFEFLCQSLQHLDNVQLGGRLLCLRGSDEKCLDIIRAAGYEIRMLGFNRDITPFARARDTRLEKWCAQHDVLCVTSRGDYTLLPTDRVVSSTGSHYCVFTPFYRAVMQEHFSAISEPDLTCIAVEDVFTTLQVKRDVEMYLRRQADACSSGCSKSDVQYVNIDDTFTPCEGRVDVGGRDEGLRCLARVAQLNDYAVVRDDIPGDKTTHLSPHLKFGTVSIREVMQFSAKHLGKSHAFTRQLIWREFYAMLLFHNPRLTQGQLTVESASGDAMKPRGTPMVNEPFLQKYKNFRWSWDEEEFLAFKAGRTGFPLVDAAVRCLTRTGWCHNRCRMLIANFLVKVLFVDWREGERWYAQMAVDYDVANNNGGWLWSAGQGADAQPYFRTFNPFRQSAQHDPQAVFIKRWVPELRDVPAKVIHSWDIYCSKSAAGKVGKLPDAKAQPSGSRKMQRGPALSGSKEEYAHVAYPNPIVDVKQRTKWVIEQFKSHNR
uniref:Putative deoxyribodipyrimidine photolyase n=1 Tax=Trypanosoma vivax (strain Y486) TaxID=1055687 RepID=G0U821_TRYVY|nr:putative deoxyribodipyrimidine photolyase [Trypanosoma vivax Y486]